MDIVAESLSAKILKSKEVLVNGQDIMDYIRSKLSVAVEFSGVYDDIDNIPLSAQFNGSIVIVDSKEYIYSDKSEPNHWQEIGDETAIRQLATDLAAVSGEVSAIFDDVSYIKTISADYKTYAETSTLLSSDGYALTADIPTDLSAFTNSPGYITKTSADADYQLKSNMSAYLLTSQMSAYEDSRITISDEISGLYEEKANLSVFKLSALTYYDFCINHNIVSNALYITEDDEMNVYGEKITNVLSGTDPTDAATVGQLNALVGSNDDLSTANTIYGVKAYTNSILGNLENIINNI